MLHSMYVYPVEDLITQINRDRHSRIALHASWLYPIWQNDGSSMLFHLRDLNGARDRIMELSVSMTDFSVTAGRKQLTEPAIARISSEILGFFSDSKQSLTWNAGAM